MKYYELDKEEQVLLESFEKGEFTSVKNQTKEAARIKSIAQHTLARSRNINIRLSERDLLKLKAKAVEKGIPYQTLVASILHQYNNQG